MQEALIGQLPSAAALSYELYYNRLPIVAVCCLDYT